MAKKKKTYRGKARGNKQLKHHPCGCYYCCGNIDEEHRKMKLKIPKHKPKNWIDKDDE